ncbi:hypothetical protein OK016_28250 [Vibrio chagasii]|nr:hypothetical protein [Vibrio chagasii]
MFEHVSLLPRGLHQICGFRFSQVGDFPKVLAIVVDIAVLVSAGIMTSDSVVAETRWYRIAGIGLSMYYFQSALVVGGICLFCCRSIASSTTRHALSTRQCACLFSHSRRCIRIYYAINSFNGAVCSYLVFR